MIADPLVPLFGDTRWMDAGACKGKHDKVNFFPHGSDLALEAKALCGVCPMLDRCRQYAMTNGIADGVWGGLTEVERRRLRVERG